MKIVVTHNSPDWDAITSVWLIKRFLPGWEDASFQFVPAGQRVAPYVVTQKDPIEHINANEVLHVDTGLGPLDHHQTSSDQVCGASLTWEYVRMQNPEFKIVNEKWAARIEALSRVVKVVVAIDHFKEVFWPDAAADYHEFSLFGLLEGLKIKNPDRDALYAEKGMEWLDYILHNFENRIWAEKEMKEKGQEFTTRFGKGLAVETINDSFLKIAQKMGYVLVVRKDPRKGYVRIKARPEEKGKDVIDLTLVYEQLQKMDPEATWFLHVSKKMLLNGTPKNPKMIPTRLTLQEIVKVIEKM
ncbi:MAG TPA: hypothetical protein VLF89_02040 [Candidatus Saccharimonadales bacterium]|nr:hypothetical protein [Candidatus Saccharimonadales bacterium]